MREAQSGKENLNPNGDAAPEGRREANKARDRAAAKETERAAVQRDCGAQEGEEEARAAEGGTRKARWANA